MTDPGQPARDARQLLSGTIRHLACGADVDELLEQAADGHAGQFTEHQRHCLHCQAALQEFSQIWEPVRRLAAEHVAVPAALKTAVASQIRKLIADVWYTLQLSDSGAIRIAARVVARIARDAARTVPGVRVAFGRSTHSRTADLAEKATLRHRHPHAAVGVLGRTAVVDLAIAVQYGDQLDAVAHRVQQRAIAELRTKVGLQDVVVNVTVDDVI
ncbi:MAG TPA: Asp23/Gls24 family envelope stress response protein [Streptosporangiaceae bacterium]